MTATPAAHRRGTIIACAAVVLGMAAFAWLSPGGAPSPPRLEASTPSDLTTLARAPAAVYLTFNARPLAALSHVSVVDASGAATDAGPVSAAGDGLRVPVRIAAPGAYRLVYHVTFSDGAELVGEVRFGVGTAVPVVEAGQPDHDPAADGGHDHGVDLINALLLLADAVTFVGAVALLLLRRPRHGATSGTRS